MIRQAQPTDYEAIKDIDEKLTIDTQKISERDYLSNMERSGFLVQNTFTLEKFEKEITTTFLVTEIEEKIVGYLRIEDATYLDKERPAIVYKPELVESQIKKPYKYLDRISLLPEYRGRKLASKMLTAAEKLLKNEEVGYLYSFVVVSPITNTASIIFHDYNGFERVDISKTFTFAGFENYQSFKYCKKLL